MKIQEIYLNLLAEQQDPNDDDLMPFGQPPDDQEMGHEEEPDEPEGQINPNDPEIKPKNVPQKPDPPKQLSRTQIIRAKWKEESPGITDQQTSDAVAFFNERKDRLKIYKPYGTRDAQGRIWVNLPEITALAQRFPEMIPNLSNEVRLKDLSYYTWEQISFYQNRIFQQAMEFDDENWVQGDYTDDQRIQMALERWKKPFNRIIDDGTLTVYKVESKSEAIALGALDHAIWRKYNTNAMGDAKRKRLTFVKDGITYPAGIHPDILREIERTIRWASQPWCIARPIGGEWGGNLWTNYRPKNAFYFILDNSKPEWDNHHIAAIQPTQHGGDKYELSLMSNDFLYHNDIKYPTWKEIVDIYPGLKDKERLFPWFGTTPREKKELSLDTITFKKDDQYYFGYQSDAIHTTYIENNRHIHDRDAFLTLSFTNRKLYVDKSTKQNNDYKQRFICHTPEGDPLGILDILKNEKIKIPGRGDTNLYQYLNDFILVTRERIPEGILAIKQAIVGSNWRPILTDTEKEYTLCSSKETIGRNTRTRKYGVMSLGSYDWIKDINYIEGLPRSYVRLYQDENGITRKEINILQIYSRSVGNVVDPHDYFYFHYLNGALTNMNLDFYKKGKFYEGPDGDAFINEKVNDGTFTRI